MRLDTLVYIKALLEAEAVKREKAWKKAGKILDEKQREAGVQWNTPDSKVDDNTKLYCIQREAFREAQAALEDFMSKEWS